MRNSKLSSLLFLLLISGCGSKQATIVQPCAEFHENESDLSIRNSIVAVSGTPDHLKSECQGTQLFVSSGTSLATGVVNAAQVAGGVTPRMVAEPTKDKGIFDTDSWTASLVKKLDGSTFQIVIPGLSQPIIVVYHAPVVH